MTTHAALSVLGADPEVAVPEWQLTYTWSAKSVPTGAAQPTFSINGGNNGSNAAKHATVTFSRAGDYVLQAVITNPSGGTATSYVPVTVSQTATTIAITPSTATVAPGETRKFNVTVRDQFGDVCQPAVTWSAMSGTIDSNGVYTAPSQEGDDTIAASVGNARGVAYISVSKHFNLYQVAITGSHVATGHEGIVSGSTLAVTNTGWISAASPKDAVRKAISGSITRHPGGNAATETLSFPANLDPSPGSDGFSLDDDPFTFNSSSGKFNGELCEGEVTTSTSANSTGGTTTTSSNGSNFGLNEDGCWDVSVTPQDNNPKSLPTVSLLDDANNDGTVNSSDNSLLNTDPGKVIDVSDDSTGTNADAGHLAAMQISVTPDTSNGQTPENTAGWTLTFSSSGGASTKIWDSLSKTNELDSGGQKTWTLSGNSFSQTVYVEQTSEGTFTNEVAFNDQAQTDRGTSTAVNTATADAIYAAKIKDNATNKTLKHDAQGNNPDAFVPLNSEDDTYVVSDNNHLKADMDQTGAIKDSQTNKALDSFLLPIKVTGTLSNGFYTLANSDPTKVKIWQHDTRETQIAPTDHLVFDAQNHDALYVEGVSIGKTTLTLQWHPTNGPVANKDTLPITVFAINGAQDVPGSSTDSYTATTAGGGLNGSFAPADAPVVGGTVATNANNRVSVTWDNNAAIDKLPYKASDNYIWDYKVNVVKVTITDPRLTNVGTVGRLGSPEKPPTGVTSSVAMNVPAIRSSVHLNLAGPKVNGKIAGVNFMEAGFIQNVTTRTAAINFTDPRGGNHPSVNTATRGDASKKALRDRITTNGSGNVLAGNQATRPWYDATSLSSESGPALFQGTNRTTTNIDGPMSMSDTPFLGFPKDGVTQLTNGTTVTAKSIALQWTFNLFFAVSSSDGTSIEGQNYKTKVFTTFAFGSWMFDGTGGITVVGGTPTWAGARPNSTDTPGNSVPIAMTTKLDNMTPKMVVDDDDFNRSLSIQVNKWPPPR